jgi:hypothetical protein
MDDLLSQGKDREPSRWPPRLLVLTILILLTIAVVRHLPSERAAAPVHPAAAKSAGPVQLAGLGSGAASLLDHDNEVASSQPPSRAQAFVCRSLVLHSRWGQCTPQ